MRGRLHSGAEMLSVKSNIDEVLRFTDRFNRQFPFAVALALTRTAQDVQRAVYDEQLREFDRPTPYTQRDLFIKKATKSNLVAEVAVKDRLYSKTTRSPVDIIGHQYLGGVRKRKAIEVYATRAGLIGEREYLVPSDGARLDAYGNMSRGQVAQIMSQLRLGIDPYQYASKSRRSAAKRKRNGYFWSRGEGLARGVWLRDGPVDVMPVLMVEGKVTYRSRIDVARIGERVTAEKFRAHMTAAWERAKATAR